jgi:RNA polymerase sigma-70 factor (ECF subfamily)
MPHSFGQQMIALLPNLRRFALSLTRSATTADDLVQITCEKALANSQSYTEGTRLDSWLFKIMRNAWIDQVRKDKTAGQAADVDALIDIAGDDGRDRAENTLMLKAARAAIFDLPDEQREVMNLVCIEELSYQETSDILGVPIGTVMSRLARARKKLASVMGINADV